MCCGTKVQVVASVIHDATCNNLLRDKSRLMYGGLNDAISFISSLYLSFLSNPMLTQVCGFIQKLDRMPDVAVMADRGFTIKESLGEMGVDLNLSPFMEGNFQ